MYTTLMKDLFIFQTPFTHGGRLTKEDCPGKHDLGPPTYSFQAEETHGNYCNQSFVNSGCSNLRAISGVGCISL